MSAIFNIVSIPFGYVMRFIYDLVGNYGVAIILFTILCKIILMPMTIKQKKSTLAMQALQPKLLAVQKKWGTDRERMAAETQKVYEDAGVSPMGGCGTMLLTFPILIGLYGVIIQPLTYFMQVNADQIAQICQILNFDQTAAGYHYQIQLATLIYENFDKVSHVAESLMQVNFSLGPISMAAQPSFSQPSILWVLPIVSGATSYLMSWLQQKTNPMQANNPQAQQTNKTMMLMMPLMSIWFGFILPVGLSFYWICNNVLAIVQDLLMNIWVKKQLEKAKDGENK